LEFQTDRAPHADDNHIEFTAQSLKLQAVPLSRASI